MGYLTSNIRGPLPPRRVRIDVASCSSQFQTGIYSRNSQTAQTALLSDSQILRFFGFSESQCN